MRLIAHGWRVIAARADRARRRIAVFQSVSVGGQVDLAEDQVDHAVEDVVLVGDVVVERHRLDAELLREPAHRERADALRVGQRDGGGQRPLPAEGRARRRMSSRPVVPPRSIGLTTLQRMATVADTTLRRKASTGGPTT